MLLSSPASAAGRKTTQPVEIIHIYLEPVNERTIFPRSTPRTKSKGGRLDAQVMNNVDDTGVAPQHALEGAQESEGATHVGRHMDYENAEPHKAIFLPQFHATPGRKSITSKRADEANRSDGGPLLSRLVHQHVIIYLSLSTNLANINTWLALARRETRYSQRATTDSDYFYTRTQCEQVATLPGPSSTTLASQGATLRPECNPKIPQKQRKVRYTSARTAA